MINECPSCKMSVKDGLEPLDQRSATMCVFCRGRHTQKELLKWRMEHLKYIDPKHFPDIIRHFYKYFDKEIDEIREVLYEIKEDREKKD